MPCVSTVVPWQAWYFARQADPKNPQPFKYTTMYFFGVEAFGGCFVPMWDRIPTNKVVAGMLPNDPDGNAFRAAWPGISKAAGYTFVDGGAYQDGTTDYTSMISKFKSQDCEIFINAPLPPDFNTFWKQAAQQGFKPKLATVAKVLLFPADTEALGDLVNNIATDSWWGPYMPYKSSLDGTTTQQLADAYQTSSGKQWLQTLGSTYSLFEVAHLALDRGVDDPHDQNAVAAELFKVNYTGMSGPLDFTTGPHIDPADPTSPTVPGIGIVNPVGVQWKKGTQLPVGDGGRRQQPQPRRADRRRPGGHQRLISWVRCSSSTTSPSGSARSPSRTTCRCESDAGDAVGIVGPNGAGKTSLFGVISGDLAPDAGEVGFDGRTVTALDRPCAAASASAGPTRCRGRSRT